MDEAAQLLEATLKRAKETGETLTAIAERCVTKRLSQWRRNTFRALTRYYWLGWNLKGALGLESWAVPGEALEAHLTASAGPSGRGFD